MTPRGKLVFSLLLVAPIFLGLFLLWRERTDKELYRQCVAQKTVEACDLYLQKAPLRKMEFAVRNLRHYLDLSRTPNTYRIGPKWIKWSANAPNVDRSSSAAEQCKLSIQLGDGSPRVTDFWSDRKSLWMPEMAKHAVEASQIVATQPQNIQIIVSDVDDDKLAESLGEANMSWMLSSIIGRSGELKNTRYGINWFELYVEVRDANQWATFQEPALPAWKR